MTVSYSFYDEKTEMCITPIYQRFNKCYVPPERAIFLNILIMTKLTHVCG